MAKHPYPRGYVVCNGQACELYARKTPSWPSIRGVRTVIGMLDGIGHEFIVTRGRGRGTMEQAYAYFMHGHELRYFSTGLDYLPEGAVVTTNTLKLVSGGRTA
ncbi:hypothetical protein NK8_53790 (plasmid) [Caballeronia sp. NK8]|nr:hypothetical protein NK8_53790 [Caballeronia sp. NK8]